MVAMDVQQCPAGLVRHNDGVVTAERVLGVTWHDGYAQARVEACAEAVDGRRGTNCGFQQLRDVALCDVNACALEGFCVPVTALPLLEQHLPVRIGKNSCLVLLLDALPYVQATDISALAFWEH